MMLSVLLAIAAVLALAVAVGHRLRRVSNTRGENIPATLEHDAGAIARCSYCGRYTDDRAVLRINWTQCSCGKTHGWCGSFKPPTEASEWSAHNRPA